MEIKKASDWYAVSTELQQRATQVGPNRDLYRLIKNIDIMVNELGRLQVKFGRVEKKYHPQIDEKRDQINQAIGYVEKMITMAMLLK